MQKLTRSLAMAGALAFAGVLAGCGDDVTVSNPTTVTVTPPSASIPVGGTVTFTAQVTGDVANKTVTWSSSDQAKATVDANGKVTGVAVGNATITATSAGDANAKASALVTITALSKGVQKVEVSPPNAIIKAGEFIQLAAQVTRDPGVAGTVTWTSSATGVATVDAAGKVTGVANGSAVITAASTVDPTVTGTMALTVRPIQPAQISVQKITVAGNTNAPVNFNNVAGQIDVTLNLDPGDQTVTKVEVLIDGATACSQNLSVSQSQQLSFAAVFADVQAVDIICSVNTAEFNTTTFAPKYPNGVRQLTAKATIGGTTPGNIATPSQALTFNNANGYAATVAFTGTTGTATNAAGFVYKRGGATITINPVIYSGTLAIATGTMTFGGAGCDAGGIGPRSVAIAGAGAAWTATFAQTGTPGAGNVASYEFNAVACPAANNTGETIRLTAVDTQGNTLFAAMQPADSASRQGVRLDNRAPGAPTFMANPNFRQNGWINAGVGLTAANAGTAATANNWLVNGTADAGVGGYNRFLRIGDGTSGTVSAAIAATASSTPALPAPTIANNSLCAVATATDALGNESALPAATAVCLAPPFANNTPTGTSNVRFGVDIAAPTIAFPAAGGLASNARVNTATVGAEFQVTVTDTGAVGNSGMLSGAAVVGTVILRNGTATGAATCIVGTFNATTGVCAPASVNAAPAFPLVSTTVVAAQTAVGYYTYTALSADAAGNTSATVTRVAVRDNSPATATSPAVPVTITGAFTASSFLNDDLSIRDYYYTVGFGGALTAPATITLAAAPTAVDAFNSATFTNTNFAINTAVNTFLGLQGTTAGNVPNAYVANAAPLNSLNLFVRDQTQAAYSAAPAAAIAPTAPAAGVSVTNFNLFTPATTNATICAGTLPAGCAAVPVSTVITAVATGTTAVFNNPFSRVDFYGSNGTDLVLLGSVASGSATLVDDGATRVWTYSFPATAASLGATLGTGVTRNIYAFGVNAAGNVALVSQAVAQTINP